MSPEYTQLAAQLGGRYQALPRCLQYTGLQTAELQAGLDADLLASLDVFDSTLLVCGLVYGKLYEFRRCRCLDLATAAEQGLVNMVTGRTDNGLAGCFRACPDNISCLCSSWLRLRFADLLVLAVVYVCRGALGPCLLGTLLQMCPRICLREVSV